VEKGHIFEPNYVFVLKKGFADPCKVVPMKLITLGRVEIRQLFTRFFSSKIFSRAYADITCSVEHSP
jgi:hypothetical protein